MSAFTFRTARNAAQTPRLSFSNFDILRVTPPYPPRSPGNISRETAGIPLKYGGVIGVYDHIYEHYQRNSKGREFFAPSQGRGRTRGRRGGAGKFSRVRNFFRQRKLYIVGANNSGGAIRRRARPSHPRAEPRAIHRAETKTGLDSRPRLSPAVTGWDRVMFFPPVE